MTTYNPTNNYLLLQPTETASTSKGGIIIPDQAKDKLNEGMILKVGPTSSPSFQINDQIVFKRHSEYRFVEDDKTEYILVSDQDVLLHRSSSKSL